MNNSNPLREVWFSDPERPIFSALLEAELERADKLFDPSFSDQSNIKTGNDVKAHFNKFTSLLKELIEIAEWIFPHEPMPLEKALTVASILRKQNVSKVVWEIVIKNAERRKRGRPITKRQIAIRALEKQILEPNRKWTHRELAQQFCECGKSQHDKSCSENLRQSMIQLKRILAKYCPQMTM